MPEENYHKSEMEYNTLYSNFHSPTVEGTEEAKVAQMKFKKEIVHTLLGDQSGKLLRLPPFGIVLIGRNPECKL